MINSIEFIKYRKLENLQLEFTKGVNVISGNNGTCKTSLLHLIANSYQAMISTSPDLVDKKAVGVIRAINKDINPKIESLTRGDKDYNDPAKGVKGNLFIVNYFNGLQLAFRRHNTKSTSRFAIKPVYKKADKQSLPSVPVIYLGLSRLQPFGEFIQDDAIFKIKQSLPMKYDLSRNAFYKSLTYIDPMPKHVENMGNIKVRTEFSTNLDGIDSNTISAGEDNLFILLTAIESLKYYYDSMRQDSPHRESILIVDELDATLHPSIQMRLLDYLNNVSKDYEIQVFFTTHSVTLIEESLRKKINVIYLINNMNNVKLMPSPDKFQIRMHLVNSSIEEYFKDKTLPVLTEDAEARFILGLLFDYLSEHNAEFQNTRSFFRFIDVNIGCDQLITLFKDPFLFKLSQTAICILDGDKDQTNGITNNIISLPGGKSPEQFLYDYGCELLVADSPFWTKTHIIESNFGKEYFIQTIQSNLESKLNPIIDGEDTKRKQREVYKQEFNSHQKFYKDLFRFWLNDPINRCEIEKFFRNLNILFKKNAENVEINKSLWNSTELN